MSTAVAEPVEAVADVVPKAETTVLFMARRSDLRLVKTPKQPLLNPQGGKVGETAGQTLEFRDGVLRIPLEGDMRIADGRKADSRELMAWLLDHPMLDNVEDGFWRVDVAAPPLSSDEAQMIGRFARQLDIDGLGAMLDAERAGWDRPKVVAALAATIEEVKGDLLKREAEVEAEVQARLEAARQAPSQDGK